MSPSPPPSPHKGNRRDEIIEIVASEYQCLYGHRCSHLLIELYQKMNQDHDQQQSQSQSQQTCLSLVEDGQMNILQALLYIHSDYPEKILSDCSPLILGRTASYLQIHHLCRLIADEASLTLAFYLDRALEPGALQMTVWDAIALLHLLGDHEDLLPLVRLSHWCHSRPEIFADETLYSSCRHIFHPKDLAAIIQEINHSHALKIDQMLDTQESFLYEKQLQIQTLEDDLEVLLEVYIGKRFILKDSRYPIPYPGSVSSSSSVASLNGMGHFHHRRGDGNGEKMTGMGAGVGGTILRIDPVTRQDLIVRWHHNASSSKIKISELTHFEFVD